MRARQQRARDEGDRASATSMQSSTQQQHQSSTQQHSLPLPPALSTLPPPPLQPRSARNSTTLPAPALSAASSSSTAPVRDLLGQAVNESRVLHTPGSGARRRINFDSEAAAFQNCEYTPIERAINNALNMEVVYIRIYLLL